MVGTSMSEDRLIVGIGEGKFNVIAGHKLVALPALPFGGVDDG
jgi:hypothetical protein